MIKGETVKMMNYECNDFGNHSKVRPSPTCYVQLRVTGGMKNIHRALEEYTKPEVMEGDNKCECEECEYYKFFCFSRFEKKVFFLSGITI